MRVPSRGRFHHSHLKASSEAPLRAHSRQKRTPDTAAPGPTTMVAITFHSAIKVACLALCANQRVPRRPEPSVKTASHCKVTCVASGRVVVAGLGGTIGGT